MGFGESVSALLESYDNCLSLLKAFKRQKKQDGSRKAARAAERQAVLRHSLRADRKKVERAYSSRVSEAGSRFEKGDSKARSALGKVLKRLNAAITSLIRLASRGPDPALDYQSLTSLSNSSRLQAIKAFDQLSRRLDAKSSRGSVVSASTSSKSSSKSTRSADSSGSSRSSGTARSSRSKTSSSTTTTAPPPPGKSSRHRGAKLTKTPDAAGSPPAGAAPRKLIEAPPPRLEPSVQTPLLDVMQRRDSGFLPLARRRSNMTNRFSILSMSSGSTRLGEIPDRRWRRALDDWGGPPNEYSAPVVYPLKPYQPTVKERRFLGLFRRGTA